MRKPSLRLVSYGTVVRTRRPNSELRRRKYLTEREDEKLIEAANGKQRGARDSPDGLLSQWRVFAPDYIILHPGIQHDN
jgi:hypothetical protein